MVTQLNDIASLHRLPAESVLTDATGRCIITLDRTFAGPDSPERVYRGTDLRVIRVEDIQFPVAVIFTPAGKAASWRVDNSFKAILGRQIAWSLATFGPGHRTRGILAHIRKELIEIEADPTDPVEWLDVATMALDGAWRTTSTPENPAGLDPAVVVAALLGKYAENLDRDWPDWRQFTQDDPIEHLRAS